jgi:MFS family permease
MSDSIEISLLSFLSLSVAAEWELSGLQQAAITAVVFTGSLIGSSIVWAPIADRYGRRISFIYGTALVSICAMFSALSPNYFSLLITRFGVGVGVGCSFVPYDLFAEFLPSSHRGKYLMSINYFWTLGSIITNGFAWLLLDHYGWRLFTLVSSIPVFIGAILSVIYLPESPRWLLLQQEFMEAQDIIHYASEMNGIKINPFRLLPLTSEAIVAIEASTDYSEPSYSPVQLLEKQPLFTEDLEARVKNSHKMGSVYLNDLNGDAEVWSHYQSLFSGEFIGITLPLWIVYICYSFTYFGVVLFLDSLYSSSSNADTHSSLSQVSFHYFDLFFNSTSEILGIFIASHIIDCYLLGRKYSQIILYSLAAFSVLCLPFTTLHSSSRFLISLLCRMSIIGASGITWVATPELYPTKLRAIGHSLCTSFSRVGAILSPFIVQNPLISKEWIGMILCFVNLISVVAVSWLPETSDQSMESIYKE